MLLLVLGLGCGSLKPEPVRSLYAETGSVRYTGMLRCGGLGAKTCTGEWTFYYPDGMLQARGSFGRGETLAAVVLEPDRTLIPVDAREGPWTEWSTTGVKLSEGEYRDGHKEGYWRFWYPSGEPKAEGAFRDDRRQGLHTTWFPDGTRKSEGRFLKGSAIGEHLRWDEHGTLRERGNFLAGRPEGVHDDWDPRGVLREQARYAGGKLQGTRSLWTSKGTLASQTTYRNGVQHGMQVLFHPDGSVRRITPYVDGRIHGTQVAFDPEGNEVYELVFRQGNPVEPDAARAAPGLELGVERVAGGSSAALGLSADETAGQSDTGDIGR